MQMQIIIEPDDDSQDMGIIINLKDEPSIVELLAKIIVSDKKRTTTVIQNILSKENPSLEYEKLQSSIVKLIDNIMSEDYSYEEYQWRLWHILYKEASVDLLVKLLQEVEKG